jgi:hypothetical protein
MRNFVLPEWLLRQLNMLDLANTDDEESWNGSGHHERAADLRRQMVFSATLLPQISRSH